MDALLHDGPLSVLLVWAHKAFIVVHERFSKPAKLNGSLIAFCMYPRVYASPCDRLAGLTWGQGSGFRVGVKGFVMFCSGCQLYQACR